jgi:hypothetical protein
MALNYVSLLITSQDAGQDAASGGVSVQPTSAVTAAGVTVVSPVPVVRQLSGGTVTISLVACDNSGTTPASGFWAYEVQLPGEASPRLVMPAFANGASQRLDNLTPVIASTTYGPAASGGVTSFNGRVGAVAPQSGDYTAVQVGADAAGAATAVANAIAAEIGAANGIASLDSGTHVPVAQLPAATTGARGAVQLDGTAGDITALGSSAAAGAVGKAADAGHQHNATGMAWPSWLAPKVTALTDAATVAVDAHSGNDFRLTLTSAVGSTRAIGAPSNPTDGQTIRFELVQPASGGPCSATWASGASGYNFGSGTAPTLSTAASAADLAAFRYSSTKGQWLYLGTVGGF